MTPPFFESEFTSWIAESRGGPRWRAYAVVTGSQLWEGDDAVIFVTGTDRDTRFNEIALSDEEGPFIQGMIIGTFATGPYVFPPEQLLPWR